MCVRPSYSVRVVTDFSTTNSSFQAEQYICAGCSIILRTTTINVGRCIFFDTFCRDWIIKCYHCHRPGTAPYRIWAVRKPVSIPICWASWTQVQTEGNHWTLKCQFYSRIWAWYASFFTDTRYTYVCTYRSEKQLRHCIFNANPQIGRSVQDWRSAKARTISYWRLCVWWAPGLNNQQTKALFGTDRRQLAPVENTELRFALAPWCIDIVRSHRPCQFELSLYVVSASDHTIHLFRHKLYVIRRSITSRPFHICDSWVNM